MEKPLTVEDVLAQVSSDARLLKEQAQIAETLHKTYLNYVAANEKLKADEDQGYLSIEAEELVQKFVDEALVAT